MGKGDKDRPRDISYEEYDLRWMLAVGRITIKEYNIRVLDLKMKSKKRKEKLL